MTSLMQSECVAGYTRQQSYDLTQNLTQTTTSLMQSECVAGYTRQ